MHRKRSLPNENDNNEEVSEATTKNIGLVLGTGGGFIGFALSKDLAGSAEEWVVLDSMHPQLQLHVQRPAELLHEVARLVVWRPDIVIHLAAETGRNHSTRKGGTRG